MSGHQARDISRNYSISTFEGMLHVRYGQQTNDSSSSKSKCWSIPWLAWRYNRNSLYDDQGVLFWTQYEARPVRRVWYEKMVEMRDLCPSISFSFLDFDGEEIKVKTYIEEKEWLFGEGWFKWLSFFTKPRTQKVLDLWFSSETGPRKGSWKGGTLGHSIDMLPDELHEEAFKRYCDMNNMKFIGVCDE